MKTNHTKGQKNRKSHRTEQNKHKPAMSDSSCTSKERKEIKPNKY